MLVKKFIIGFLCILFCSFSFAVSLDLAQLQFLFVVYLLMVSLLIIWCMYVDSVYMFLFDYRLKCSPLLMVLLLFNVIFWVSWFNIKKKRYLCNVDSSFYTVFSSCMLFVLLCGVISWQVVVTWWLVMWRDKLVPGFTPVVSTWQWICSFFIFNLHLFYIFVFVLILILLLCGLVICWL